MANNNHRSQKSFRPLQKTKVDELKVLANHFLSDHEILREIVAELKHRRAKDAICFRELLVKTFKTGNPIFLEDELRDTRKNEEDMKLTALMSIALQVEKNSTAKEKNRKFHLKNGQIIPPIQSGNYKYLFKTKSNITISEDEFVDIHIDKRKKIGTVLSAKGTITLLLQNNQGDEIKQATLTIDHTKLLRKLIDIYHQLFEAKLYPFNFDMALAVNNLAPPPTLATSYELIEPRSDLNPEQWQAVRQSNRTGITFLWGPPGTGKTNVEAKICLNYMAQGKTILVVAHTNLAVDTLIERICEHINSREPKKLHTGAVIRHGEISKPTLNEKFGQFLDQKQLIYSSIEASQRKQKNIMQELASLRSKLEAHKGKIAEASKLNKRRKQCKVEIKATEHEFAKAKTKSDIISKILSHVSKLSLKIINISTSIPILGHLTKSILVNLLAFLENHEKKLSAKREKFYLKLQKQASEINNLASQVKSIFRAVRARPEGQPRFTKIVTNKISELDAQLSAENGDYRFILRKIDAATQICGATANKVIFDNLAKESQYDAVVIDEASMLSVPIVTYLAGLVRKHLVIAGDFRQLPPIVGAEGNPIIKKLIADDIFAQAGITKAIDSRVLPPNCILLTTQYRMHPLICDVVSEIYYNNLLKTADSIKCRPWKEITVTQNLSIGPLTIIDTSRQPSMCRPAGRSSRTNLLQALMVQTLAKLFCGQIDNDTDIGLITPYASQAELLSSLLAQSKSCKLSSGTVHKYQGSERDIIIYEVADGEGSLPPSRFIRADDIAEQGARLLNVALSRARSNIIMVANLQYLRENLRKNTIFLKLLNLMEEKGKIIPVNKILRPISTPSNEQQKPITWYHRKNSSSPLTRDVTSAQNKITLAIDLVCDDKLSFWEKILQQAVVRGVKVEVVVTAYSHTDSTTTEGTKRDALAAMQKAGIVVSERNVELADSETYVLIDEQILWYSPAFPSGNEYNDDQYVIRVEGERTCSLIKNSVIYPLQERTLKTDRQKSAHKRKTKPVDRSKKCTQCDGYLELRKGKYGKFLGCSNYPRCKNTLKVADPK